MKIHKKLSWLKEYIELAKPIIPEIRNIYFVREIFHQKNKLQKIHASLTYEFIFGSYVLSLYTRFKRQAKKPRLAKEEEYSKIELLENLAHELAHLKHWEHTPEHKVLESKLSILFMERLLESGYISAEEEYRDKRAGKRNRNKKS